MILCDPLCGRLLRGFTIPEDCDQLRNVAPAVDRSELLLRFDDGDAHPAYDHHAIAPTLRVARVGRNGAQEGDRLRAEALLCDWTPTYTPWLTGVPSGVDQDSEQNLAGRRSEA